jgi:poly(A) polymerase
MAQADTPQHNSPPSDDAGAAARAARDEAVRIVRRLRAGGHIAYLAGGCVRDELLGLHPKDFDVATDATPDRVRDLVPKAHRDPVGKAFGVMLARGETDRSIVTEIATFRTDGDYSDQRRPDAVEFSTPEEDARRRDFTINALFLDPLATDADDPGYVPELGRVIDFVGGRQDLREGVVRAVGVARDRLREDHLRALRAVRFAARLGFRLDDETAGAVRDDASELRGVAPERVGDELRRMLGHAGRAEAARLLVELGLAPVVLGLPDSGPTPAMPRGPLALAALPAVATPAHALAAWTVDLLPEGVGAPIASIAAAAEPMVGRLRRSLTLSNDEVDAVRGILGLTVRLERDWPNADAPPAAEHGSAGESRGVALQKRLAASPWFSQALALVSARHPVLAEAIAGRRAELAATSGGLDPEPWVTGDDLIAAGLPPGPGFRDRLRRAYDAQLSGRAADRGAALAIALESTG